MSIASYRFRITSYSFALLRLQESGERGGVGKGDLMQPAGGHVVAVAFGKVVDNGDVVALLEQEADGVGADVTGSTSNQNFSWSHGV